MNFSFNSNIFTNHLLVFLYSVFKFFNLNSTNLRIYFNLFFSDLILYVKQKGVFRECFSTSFKLGRRSNPVQVTSTCQVQRTQSDPKSSIRACICTTDFCNGQDDTPNNNVIDLNDDGI